MRYRETRPTRLKLIENSINCIKCNKKFLSSLPTDKVCFDCKPKSQICRNCHNRFYPTIAGARYCSPICRTIDSFLFKESICEFCKNPINKCAPLCGKLRSAKWSLQRGVIVNLKYTKLVLLGDNVACQLCGWNLEPNILQLHHKDRNRKNNQASNLIVICPNCHVLDHYKNKDGLYNTNREKARRRRFKLI